MRLLATAILMLTICQLAAGQPDSSELSRGDDLSLSIKALTFAKNNEYFNPIAVSAFSMAGTLPWPVRKSLWVEGYTLTGFFFRPELVYRASGKVTLRGGVHLLKYSGRDRFTTARPLLSLSVKLGDKSLLTLGSLKGSSTHMMFDPHFDSERLYWAFAEEGAEVLTKGKYFFNDAWVNWENFIFAGDTTQERFTFGESFRYTSPLIGDFMNIEIPVQVQFKHFGGQISDYPEKVRTFFNFAGGARINFDLAGKRYGTAGVEYLQFLNNVIPSRENDPIAHGKAGWLRFHYTIKDFYAGVYYWKANNFYASNGNGIYASVFDFSSGYVIGRREILTSCAYLNILPESFLELCFGIETYYDIRENHLDHAIQLHLNLEKVFNLVR